MKVARVLHEAGITTCEAIARANPTGLQQTPKAAELKRMNPEGWIEQAELTAKGDGEALNGYRVS
jgi:predicted flap endonuclease-1-like 5' DNA nuclease